MKRIILSLVGALSLGGCYAEVVPYTTPVAYAPAPVYTTYAAPTYVAPPVYGPRYVAPAYRPASVYVAPPYRSHTTLVAAPAYRRW